MTVTRNTNIEDAIHAVSGGAFPSVTCLSTWMLHKAEAEAGGGLSEAEERAALAVAEPVRNRQLSEVEVITGVHELPGKPKAPTVVISERVNPGADRWWAIDHFSWLNEQGEDRERQDALEGVHSELQRWLPAHKVNLWADKKWPKRWSDEFERLTSDIGVFTLRADPREMWNVQLRNRRWGIHDKLSDEDREEILCDVSRRIVLVFVVPRSTKQFRREVAEASGGTAIVIDTGIYVSTSPERLEALRRSGLMRWDAMMPAEAYPLIAEMAAEAILGHEVTEWLDLPSTPDVLSPKTKKAEIKKIRERIEYAELVAEVKRLARTEVKTWAEAAEQVGPSVSTLRRAFKRMGEPSPFGHGGDHSSTDWKASVHV